MLFPRSRYKSPVHFCKLAESCPERLLSPSTNLKSEGIEHIELGIPPNNLFMDRSMTSSSCKFFSLLIDDGMLPFNKLPETASTFKLDNSPIFKGIGPDNKLFLKKRYARLYRSGIPQSKRLELKSTILHTDELLKDSELGSFPLSWFLERSKCSICGDIFQSHSGIMPDIPTFFLGLYGLVPSEF